MWLPKLLKFNLQIKANRVMNIFIINDVFISLSVYEIPQSLIQAI